MSDLLTTKLSDVADVVMGQSPDSSSYNEKERGYPFLQGCADFGARYPSTKIYCDQPTKIVREHAILISVRAPVGEINRADRAYCLGRGLAGIVAHSTDQDYLYYAVDFERGQLHRVAQGTTFEAINSSDIKQLLFYKPSRNAQEYIARTLIAVDNLIEKTEALVEKYQAIKQGMMHDLFTCGIDANGQLRPRYQDAPHLYKQTELGWIPKEWDLLTIGKLATRVGSGVTPTGGSEIYTAEGVMFLRSQNVTFDGLKLDDVAFINLKTHQSMLASEVFPFDVLINITGASIGRCCYLPSGLGTVNTNQHVCAVRLAEPTEGKAIFLSKLLASNIGQNQIYRFNAGGNREGLNYQQLRSFRIPWPSEQEIEELAVRLVALDKTIICQLSHLDKLKAIKKGFMQDFLTGKVRVIVEKSQSEIEAA